MAPSGSDRFIVRHCAHAASRPLLPLSRSRPIRREVFGARRARKPGRTSTLCRPGAAAGAVLYPRGAPAPTTPFVEAVASRSGGRAAREERPPCRWRPPAGRRAGAAARAGGRTSCLRCCRGRITRPGAVVLIDDVVALMIAPSTLPCKPCATGARFEDVVAPVREISWETWHGRRPPSRPGQDRLAAWCGRRRCSSKMALAVPPCRRALLLLDV
eukprot:scaffold820_cov376-Prasinococcus_capsulatus_cf.AAC.8